MFNLKINSTYNNKDLLVFENIEYANKLQTLAIDSLINKKAIVELVVHVYMNLQDNNCIINVVKSIHTLLGSIGEDEDSLSNNDNINFVDSKSYITIINYIITELNYILDTGEYLLLITNSHLNIGIFYIYNIINK